MKTKADTLHGNGPTTLTVYFSHSGNTRQVAKCIHEQVGGDIVEIIPMEEYPTDYDAVVAQAEQEVNARYLPALRTTVANIKSYDVIFIGSPNWWSTFAPPIRTFLTENDLSGKVLSPFITHEGSGLGRSVNDIAQLCSRSRVLDGLAIRGRDVGTAQSKVSQWLHRLGLVITTGASSGRG